MRLTSLCKNKFMRIFFMCILIWGGPLLIFGNSIPQLISEGQFFDSVKKLGKSQEIQGLSDEDVRRKIQSLALKHGFHLEFADILLRYKKTSEEGVLPLPFQIGYTLRVDLPLLMGEFKWPIMACRVYDLENEAEKKNER